MIAILEEPQVRERVPTISLEAYHGLYGLSGSARWELIRGVIIEKMSQSPLHGSIVELLRVHLEAALPAEWHVRQEKPLTLTDSEPEPDLAVVRGSRSAFRAHHPTGAELVVEVVVSSERLDRIKLGIYAEAGIPECWLLLAEEKVLERHTEPLGSSYRRMEQVAYPACLASTVCGDLVLPPADLL